LLPLKRQSAGPIGSDSYLPPAPLNPDRAPELRWMRCPLDPGRSQNHAVV